MNVAGTYTRAVVPMLRVEDAIDPDGYELWFGQPAR